MLIDFREHADGSEIACDVCVIGSGAAGITLAVELDRSGLNVVVLAGGPARREAEADDLYVSRVVGLEHKGIHEGRARVHGGTTTLWAGQALTLDPIDFERRDWVPHSGWPFRREAIDAYYRRAEGIMKLPEISYDEQAWPNGRPRPPKFDPAVLHARISHYTHVPDFSVMYRDELAGSKNVRVMLNAHAVGLVTNLEATRLDRVEVKSLSGKTASIRAKEVVVCCGAIETARLLLASDAVDPRGVGNGHDLVGRYYQEHIHGKAAPIRPTDPKQLRATFDPFAHHGTRYGPKICASDAIQRDHRTLNIYGDFCYEIPEDSAVDAAKLVLKSLKRPDLRPQVPRALWHVARRPHEVAIGAAKWAMFRTPMTSRRGTIYLGIQSEQAPNPDSRITLGDDRDALGMRRSVLDWRLTALDRHSILAFVEQVAREFARLGLGTIDTSAFSLPEDLSRMGEAVFDANHHIGMARMHDDPREGVVDRECRVHGIGNLSIGSSAVFPTGGASNPTLTIIALCLRIADRVKRELAASPA